MKIEDTYYACELEDIMNELISQLQLNGYPYFQKGYKRSGNSLQMQCPFHGDGMESKPSFGIRKSDGKGHCFACGKIVELPELITYCFNQNDILENFGRRWLRKNFMAVEIEERKDIDLDFNRSRKVQEQEIEYVSEEELDSYRYYHPYWTKRGITDERIIELFDLGYDSKTDCITFPVRDVDGRCLFVARRSTKTKFFNYPEGVEKPLYGLYELYNSEYQWGYMNALPHDCHEVIVCESMIDCILLWQAGHFAVALNGLGNSLQMKQLRELLCRKLILATDNDNAGSYARDRIKLKVTNKIFTEIIFPEGIKDIGECTKEQQKNILEWEILS